LREEYRKVYGRETTATNKGFLLKKIAWGIQELEFGGIPEKVKDKAVKIVEELDLTGRIPSAKLRVTDPREVISAVFYLILSSFYVIGKSFSIISKTANILNNN